MPSFSYCLCLAWSQQVWNLTLTMIASKHLRAKAAETHGLLLFVVELLQKYKPQLIFDGNTPEQNLKFQLLLAAGDAALAFDKILAEHERSVEEQSLFLLFSRYNEFANLCARAKVPLIPKTHLMFHLIQRASVKGNPRVYSTYKTTGPWHKCADQFTVVTGQCLCTGNWRC